MKARRVTFGQVATAAVLATGFAVVWGVVTGILLEAMAVRPRVDEGLVFGANGTAYIVRTSGPRFTTEYFDVDRKPIVPLVAQETVYARLLSVKTSTFVPPLYLPSWNERIRAYSDHGRPETYWYLILDGRDDGRAYFVGYDSRTNQRVGFIGTNGFRPDDLPEEEWFQFTGQLREFLYRIVSGQFAGTKHSNHYVIEGGDSGISAASVFLPLDNGRIVRVDLATREVSVAFEDDGVVSAQLTEGPDPRPGRSAQVLAVRTHDSVALVDKDDRLIGRWRLPPELVDEGFMWVTAFGGLASAYRALDILPNEPTETFILYTFDEQGQVTQRETVEINRYPVPDTTAWGLGVIVPMPVALNVAALLSPWELQRENETYGHALARFLRAPIRTIGRC